MLAFTLDNLSINELMQIEVSSVSRKSQTLSNTAAAAFVITQEDIHRSGATSIPEALRLAPGLEVAQIGAHTWAVTSRGFNGQYANKLLVLMDGRTVYTPLFSGVFWNLQDTMMEDIERIEVIRGPGAAMWGANAVNGVINVITKKAKDTHGDLVVAGAGNQERGFAGFRHGGSLGNDGSYRVYGKGYSREASVNTAGQSQDDAARSVQLGFRIDRNIPEGGRLTLQGDAYHISSGNPLRSHAILVPPYTSYIPHDDQSHGGNLLARWESALSNGSEISLQGYYDRVQFGTLLVSSAIDTYDIDFQQRLHPNAAHDLMWGANYRHIHSAVDDTADISFSPASIGYQNASVFIQDDIALVPHRLRLTLGAKAENNHFGGMQFQPNIRLLWTPDNENSVWFATSNASRTPSQGEAHAAIAMRVTPPSAQTAGLPVQAILYGNPDLGAEKVTALEAGYRTQWGARLSSDIAAFSNHYRNLVRWAFVGGAPTPALAPVPHLILPMVFSNAAATTRTYGVEMSADWRALEWMRLEGAFTYTRMNAPPWDGLNYDAARLIPRTQESVRCLMNLNKNIKLDLALRHVGNLSSITQNVPAYTALDARLGYTPRKGLEFSLVGQDLFDARHAEFALIGIPAKQIPRSIYAKATWRL